MFLLLRKANSASCRVRQGRVPYRHIRCIHGVWIPLRQAVCTFVDRAIQERCFETIAIHEITADLISFMLPFTTASLTLMFTSSHLNVSFQRAMHCSKGKTRSSLTLKSNKHQAPHSKHVKAIRNPIRYARSPSRAFIRNQRRRSRSASSRESRTSSQGSEEPARYHRCPCCCYLG